MLERPGVAMAFHGRTADAHVCWSRLMNWRQNRPHPLPPAMAWAAGALTAVGKLSHRPATAGSGSSLRTRGLASERRAPRLEVAAACVL